MGVEIIHTVDHNEKGKLVRIISIVKKYYYATKIYLTLIDEVPYRSNNGHRRKPSSVISKTKKGIVLFLENHKKIQ